MASANRPLLRANTAILAAALLACAPQRATTQAPAALTDSAFAALVTRLSEPSGYFDTDNLISNEDSYLHPVTTLRNIGTTGGVYVGVGPDQNFSYIAAVRPHAAFIVDVRRDNLLEHLLFKATFALSRNRVEYLALLFGRAAPGDTAGWAAKPIDSLLFYIDAAKRDSAAEALARERVMAEVRRLPLELSSADFETIARFHNTFIAAGPALRFNTFGRAPQPYYPDYRQLASGLDRDGRQAGFLATESAFQFVKDLEARNLVIPVVGNFAGTHALAGVAQWMEANGETLSALYTSNVEQYLFRGEGGFAEFAKSVERFPRNAKSAIIRSCFTCGGGHPHAVAGYHAVMTVQLVDRFVELRQSGQLGRYYDLVTTGLVTP
ncbi:MAG: hypothetical protein O2973_01410 [Gemmatimonadetes bacterium]|nr:hypothetical protein [Gemmatimonadota bacterium]